ncbi:hypothetical protein Dsin_016352 [Dipteronia sinensis]|uniref:Reverse transcriptase domain-containing protein n=1 Tax=Dipteronia sinensis TaxID=43782 RepID=A0AAE0ACX5_9ROSI|nr:hypothetical protein Dsin_016352 [Dipteronia sinensis]
MRECTAAVLERLDKGLCCRNWRNLFPQSMIKHLEFWGSDHRPLVLDLGDDLDTGRTKVVNRKRRFFFEECWIEDSKCKEIVCSAWNNNCGGNWVKEVLSNIDTCGRNLKVWNTKMRRDMRANLQSKNEALRKATDVDIPVLWKVVQNLEKELNEVLNEEERYWSQRAKVEWLRNGDRNTRFFHSKASVRKARNKIKGLVVEGGNWKVAAIDLERITCHYFDNLFKSCNPTESDLAKVWDGVQARISTHSSRLLETIFTGEEVRKTVFDMSPMKAPGCDGLPAIFYQKFWDSIGSSVIMGCLKILNDGHSVEDFNKTIIALIPKTQNPIKVEDYRPISLCTVLYKIIAKTISNRLRQVLGDVISENQCAFIPGRLISDNTIVGFECLHRLETAEEKTWIHGY